MAFQPFQKKSVTSKAPPAASSKFAKMKGKSKKAKPKNRYKQMARKMSMPMGSGVADTDQDGY